MNPNDFFLALRIAREIEQAGFQVSPNDKYVRVEATEATAKHYGFAPGAAWYFTSPEEARGWVEGLQFGAVVSGSRGKRTRKAKR